MHKIITASFVALFIAACGPQPAQQSVHASTYTTTSAAASTCCECLEQTDCLIPPQHALEKECRFAIDSAEVPNYISHCLAGEPGKYPQGICTQECAVLFE